jgi:F0F1-type ATP synthase assembly protein I
MADTTATDTSTVNLVVWFVGGATVIVIVGCFILRAMGKDVSDLVPIATLGLGALAGLLSSPRSVNKSEALKEIAEAKAEQEQSPASKIVNMLEPEVEPPPTTGVGTGGEQLV